LSVTFFIRSRAKHGKKAAAGHNAILYYGCEADQGEHNKILRTKNLWNENKSLASTLYPL